MEQPTAYTNYDRIESDRARAVERLASWRAKVFADGTVVLAGALDAFHLLPEMHYNIALYSMGMDDLATAGIHLRHATDYLRHIFAMAALPAGESVGFVPPDIPGTSMVGSGTTGPVPPTSHSGWITAMEIALYVGNIRVVDQLVAFDEFHLGGHGRAHPLYEQWVDLYRSAIRQPADLAVRLNTAFDTAGAVTSPPDFASEVRLLILPTFRVYAGVATSEQQIFADGLVASDEAHVDWYRQRGQLGTRRVLFNRHGSAMEVLGRERGLVAPSSPYRRHLD